MKNRICIGSAQFGMNYGISNHLGRTSIQEVRKILDYAFQNNIDYIDTAQSYGIAEEIIGQYHSESYNRFKIISKFIYSSDLSVGDAIDKSISKTGVDTLYAILIHNFNDLKYHNNIIHEIESIKEKKKVKKIGVSLYKCEELEYLFDNEIKIDIVQIPYSILDRRFEKYFNELKKRKIEIYARSIFLQGLIFMSPNSLPTNLLKAKPIIEEIIKLSRINSIEIEAIAVNFVLFQKNLDKVIVGVNNFDQFKSIIVATDEADKAKKIIPELYGLKIDDENILLPINWN